MRKQWKKRSSNLKKIEINIYSKCIKYSRNRNNVYEFIDMKTDENDRIDVYIRGVTREDDKN